MKSPGIVSSPREAFLSLAALLVVMLACSTPAHAGSGTFTNGRFNFCVSVRFNATDAELARIRAGFQAASQVLSDATDGQHRFGTVTIVNNSGASQSAEFWVFKPDGREKAPGRFGVRGEHVLLYYARTFGADADNTAYTIAHEMGHHAYGLKDEYSGPGLADGADCADRPDTNATNHCLMDNYKSRGGRAAGGNGTYTLNEFCVTGNHDRDKNNWQETINHKACWTQVAEATQKFRATAPAAGVPTSAPPAAHAVDLKDGCANCSGLKVVLVLDRSGSLAGQPFVDVQNAANLFIDYLRVGDSVGVVSFASDATVNFSLTALTSDSQKAAIKGAVNSLDATGNTNIGGGLQAGLSQLTAQTQRGCNELIVLLTDGDHNTGTAPASVVPAIQAAGVTVITVGVGSGISSAGQSSLMSIATQTGGKYYSAAQSSELFSNFLKLVQEGTDNSLTAQAPQSIVSGQTTTISAPVEAGAQTATFGVTTTGSSGGVQIALRSPSGTLLTEASASGNPNLVLSVGPHARSLQVNSPEAGTWSIIVTAGDLRGGSVDVLAFARNDGVQLVTSVLKDTLAFPEVAVIRAMPQYRGESVVGAVVGGYVVRPGGSRDPITLFDDGRLADHGDEQAGDGVYTARYANYTVDGTYTFELTAVNATGTTAPGESFDASAPSGVTPVPAFIRLNSTTAVVTGIPDLSITSTASPSIARQAGNITYTLTVRNNGASAIANVRLQDNLPAGVRFVSCAVTSGSGTCGGTDNNRTATFTSLSAGSSGRVSIVATVDAAVPDGAVIVNASSVTPATGEPFVSNNAATVSTAVLSTAGNPADNARFYVRQHYLDFLNREPDDPGLNFWIGGITSCGANVPCAEVKRVDTSAAFFLSIEFQQTGFLVYRLQKASYGTLPRLDNFLADTRTIGQGVVVNAAGWEQKLEGNKAAFVEQWAGRLEFHVAFDGKTSAQYVDALASNAGITLGAAERNDLVTRLNAGTVTRAAVLRHIAENATFARQEFNSAFVLMQYFGYLRRNPDDAPDADFSGYNFWLKKLNDFGGDYRQAEMVKAFLNSFEYRSRFTQ
ncbi:MAG TPA: VWA domain-containing protein [Pyrinomonadaceae bacterium]|jgi:uncharacterized repeat protein (TIGR01451 family)